MDKIILAIAFNKAKTFVYIKPFNGATLFVCHGNQYPYLAKVSLACP